MSLMDQLTDVISSQIAGQAASKTGMDARTAKQLAPMAVAVLMNGLKKNAAEPSGAEALARALQNHDGDLLSNLGRVGDDQVVNDGRKILGHILGGKQDGAERALAGAAGVDKSQVAALLAMAAPVVLASLGREKNARGLDVAGLAGLVTEEGIRAERTAPNELGGVLKFLDADGDGDITDEVLDMGAKMLGGLFGKK